MKETRQDLNDLLEQIRTSPELTAYFKTRQSYLDAKITTYEAMWSLFVPGQLVYAKPFMKTPQLFTIDTAPYMWDSKHNPPRLNVSCWCYDWNGKEIVKACKIATPLSRSDTVTLALLTRVKSTISRSRGSVGQNLSVSWLVIRWSTSRRMAPSRASRSCATCSSSAASDTISMSGRRKARGRCLSTMVKHWLKTGTRSAKTIPPTICHYLIQARHSSTR